MPLDFPSNPTNGQVYDNFYYDAAKSTWKSLSSGASPSVLTSPTITNAVISATAPNANTVPLTVNGAASQSANLQEWRNNSGTVLSSIDSSGNITLDSARVTNLFLNRQNSASEGGQINLRRSIDNADYWFIDAFGNTLTPSLRMIASTQTNMEIDALGRVFMPNKPAFNGQSIAATANGGVATHGDVWFNTGNHYNTSNGRFTAPVSGYYLVSAGVLINSGGSGFVVMETLINGTSRRGPATSAHGPSGSEHGASASSICYLNANDYITVNLYSSTGQSTFVQQNSWGSQRNFFSVYMLG